MAEVAPREEKSKKSYHNSPEWQAAIAAGVDMNLLESNLAKTPYERCKDHDRALALVRLLESHRPGSQ